MFDLHVERLKDNEKVIDLRYTFCIATQNVTHIHTHILLTSRMFLSMHSDKLEEHIQSTHMKTA